LWTFHFRSSNNEMAESSPWAASVQSASASALANLRLTPNLEIAEIADIVWLRGPHWDEAIELELRRIGGLRSFRVLADGALLPHGARVPVGRLPNLRWQALRTATPVRLPAADSAGMRSAGVRLRLVPSASELPASAVLTSSPAWHDWVVAAPAFRLRPLRFAAARDRRVWVEGAPVPSLEGRRFYVREGIAVPCGFAWSPPVDALVLARIFELAIGDVALASEDESWEIIKDEQFVPATRSSARLTMEAFERNG
jgi:hypothetical protein